MDLQLLLRMWKRSGRQDVLDRVTLTLGKMADEGRRLEALRNRLEDAILRTIPGTAINGARQPRVPNTTNISFDHVEA